MAIADIHDRASSPFIGHDQGRLGDLLYETDMEQAASYLLRMCREPGTDQEIQDATHYFGALVLEDLEYDWDEDFSEHARMHFYAAYNGQHTRWAKAGRSVLALYAEGDESLLEVFSISVFFSDDRDEQRRAYMASRNWLEWLLKNDRNAKDRALLGHNGLLWD
jgi:hypothetical protein